MAGFYGSNGNVSVDPVNIVKLMLLLFWMISVASGSRCALFILRSDYLWFLGYGLEDEVPIHSVLSKASLYVACLDSAEAVPQRGLPLCLSRMANQHDFVARLTLASAIVNAQS